ncbi:hypothetical protein HF086_001427 [Spodoptera exigua]|uniref:DUF5110 domain-containing protein n=1 Tax=Spodoptera exigua TaxID=7107 RepID=A0A922MVD1_SPOEX|nr:hypothetical protein HF086_001427 [Spodoptera exigua]
MRPLFQEYPKEEDTYTIDDQYLLDSEIDCTLFYKFKTKKALWAAVKSSFFIETNQAAPKIPVFQRGGAIVLRKERVRRSSALMADDPYTIVVALDINGTAEGSLYIDDGETYEYKNNKYIYAKLAFVNEKASYPTRSWVERIVIAGIKTPPKTAKLVQGDKQTSLQMTLHKGNDVLVVRKPAASMAQPWKITFSY